MRMNEAWIGRCPNPKCGYEGRIKPTEEIMDEDGDVKIDSFYCPKCGIYIGLI